MEATKFSAAHGSAVMAHMRRLSAAGKMSAPHAAAIRTSARGAGLREEDVEAGAYTRPLLSST
jgi:hypothetical protein